MMAGGTPNQAEPRMKRTFPSLLSDALSAALRAATVVFAFFFLMAAFYGDIGLFVPAGRRARSANEFLVLMLVSAFCAALLSKRKGAAGGVPAAAAAMELKAGESFLLVVLPLAAVAVFWLRSCYLSAVILLDGARAAFPPLWASHLVYGASLAVVAAAGKGMRRSSGTLASFTAACLCATAPLHGYVSVEAAVAFAAAGALWWLFILLGGVRTDRRRDIALACLFIVLALAAAREVDHLRLRWSWEQLRSRLTWSVVRQPGLGVVAGFGLWALWRERKTPHAERLGAALLFVAGAAMAGVVKDRALGEAGAILMVPFAAVATGLGARQILTAMPLNYGFLPRNVAIVAIAGLLAAEARTAIGRGPAPPEHVFRYGAWHDAAWPGGVQKSSSF